MNGLRYGSEVLCATRLAAVALVLVFGLAGCERRGASPSATVTPVSPSPQLPAEPSARQAVEAALTDAARRLNVPQAQLRVEQVDARDWPDTSLGCPQPGMMYAQVITPGYLAVISGAGRRLEYHTDTRGRVVLCRQG